LRLEHLALSGFRNLAPLDLSVDARFVVVHGQNAQGKTNLLEAVYLLSTLKPLRGRRSADLVGWQEERAAVSAVVRHDGLARRYRIDLGASRTVRLDGEVVRDLAPYFRGIRAIAFTPSDARIVSGEPRLRRRWLDRAAFTARPSHLDVVRRFQRVLDQKGAALKSAASVAVLDVLDDQLALAGAQLVVRRAALISSLRDPVSRVHDAIVGQRAELDLGYASVVPVTEEKAVVKALREGLAASRSEARRRRRAVWGPQSDDVQFSLAGPPARRFASQGQVRSVVLALRLGELIAAHERGDAPLFLLDDVSSELDAARTDRLAGVLKDLDAQVIATTTDAAHLSALPAADTLVVSVANGVVAV